MATQSLPRLPPKSLDGEVAVFAKTNKADSIDESEGLRLEAGTSLAKRTKGVSSENDVGRASSEKHGSDLDDSGQKEAQSFAGGQESKSLPESQIPVLQESGDKEPKTGGTLGRLAASLGVVIIVGLALFWFSRWWGKRHKSNEMNAKIRLLSQFHLGPKKNLSIVRVAGETILLGVTDQNINMIKSLALIDDELPESTTEEFEASLNKLSQDGMDEGTENISKAQDSEMPGEDFQVAQIRDRVSARLKKMRSL
jgi:flagellar protein FliO/FliZ